MTAKSTADVMLEKDLERAVEDLLTVTGWTWYHTHRSDRSPAGFPDLVAFRGERLLFAELKREKGRTTKAQDVWLAGLRRVPGIEVVVWRPSHLLDGTITAALTR